jgi:hypothetical protein
MANRARAGHPRLAAHHRLVAGAMLVILLTGLVPPAFPQLAVFDASNFAQSIMQVAYEAQQIAIMLRELASWANVGVALQLVADIESLMGQIDRISQQMQGRRGLWGNPPSIMTSVGLAEFRAQYGELCQTVRSNAFSAQLLISDVTRLLGTLMTILNGISILSGSTAGLQAVTTAVGNIAGQMAGLQTMVATANEATMCEQWQYSVRRAGMRNIEMRMFRRYGMVNE